MKKLEISIPENEKEFFELKSKDKDQIIDDYFTLKSEMNNFILNIIEESIADILIKNPEIETLVLDPKYEYNDEGYAPHYIMPFINGDYNGNDIDDDLFEKIDYACSKVANLITEDMSIDVDLVRKKYSAKKLDQDLPKNTNEKKRKKI